MNDQSFMNIYPVIFPSEIPEIPEDLPDGKEADDIDSEYEDITDESSLYNTNEVRARSFC